MRYRLQRLLALITVMSILIALLAACGETGGDAGTTGQATQPTGAEPTQPTGAEATQPTGAEPTQPTDAEATQPTGAEATQPTGDQTSAGACPDTAQGQQITMWSPLTGPDGKFMTDLATQFSQANDKGITVNHLAQPEYVQKLNAAAAANQLPDLTVIRADDIATMAARNIVKPMTEDVLGILGDLSADFPEQVWGVSEYNGQHYALPLDVHPLVLYYNKDLFQQAGIPEPGAEPMTREEFEQAAEALNKDGVAGIAVGTAFQGATIFMTLVQQFGGRLSNEDGTQATYNSEAGVEALTYLRDLKQKHSPQVSGAGDPEVKLFQQGRAAMVIHGPWHISDMEKLPFTGFAPVPQFGDEYAVWGGSHQLALTTDDPARQAAAACWMSWLSENSLAWAKAGQVPLRESVRTSEELAQEAPAISAVAGSATEVIMPPPVPGLMPAIWGEGFGPAVDAVLLGQQQDVKQALDEAANTSNKIIEDNRRRYGGG